MWGPLPQEHRLWHADFFRCFNSARSHIPARFCLPYETHITQVVGNPPFGGTLDPQIQDELDADFGFRLGEKVKKESYSFFIIKCVELLPKGGRLTFICSDTFLTIKTMRGLRRYLMSQGNVSVTELPEFSDETNHPMVVLNFLKTGHSDRVQVNGCDVPRHNIELTGNFSWQVKEDDARFFAGLALSDYVVASSGMTIGKNEFFLREIESSRITEPFTFEFFDEPITLEKELRRARLGKIGPRKRAAIIEQESAGATRRNVRITRREKPVELQLPHADYCFYNKATNQIVYAPPTHAIYWKDEGDAVLTFKKNGNWYLHGVGGMPYFKRDGLTWQLIASRLHTRYLPSGYILDSGAPCAFLKPGIPHDELFMILGWTLTSLCNRLLKEVINHTKNIQSKDFERLPYPFWVSSDRKQTVIRHVIALLDAARNGRRYSRNCPELRWLDEQFTYDDSSVQFKSNSQRACQSRLF
jgi:hypothetical protein